MFGNDSLRKKYEIIEKKKNIKNGKNLLYKRQRYQQLQYLNHYLNQNKINRSLSSTPRSSPRSSPRVKNYLALF